MADARAQELPLVTTGDSEFVEHDFHAIFSNLGVLEYDTEISLIVRILGWCGMLACVAWLALRLRAREPEPSVPTVLPKPAISLLERYPGKAYAKLGTPAPAPVSNESGTHLARKPDAGE